MNRRPYLLHACIASLIAIAAAASPTVAAPPASIVVFPRVVSDAAQDTLIQIVNAASRQTFLRCTYFDTSGTPGDAFDLVLGALQPTHWVVSRGRIVDAFDVPCGGENLDCDGAGLDPGTIPPVAVPFDGALTCVQLDRSGAPLSGNALRGRATLVENGGGDVMSYDALGLLGFESNDGDDLLCLDGDPNPACAVAEYSGCPTQWHLVHEADGAAYAPESAQRIVRSALTALPCGLTRGGTPSNLPVQVDVTNEFDETFSAAAQIPPLSPTLLTDVSPILTRASAGSDTLATRISSVSNEGFLLVQQTDRRLTGDDGALAGRTASSSNGAGTAIVTFPYVIVDAARGVDTVVRLANLSDASVGALCTYEDVTPTCVGTGPADGCLPGHSGCSGFCRNTYGTLGFHLALAPGQPLGWRVGSGLQRAGTENGLASADVPAVAAPFVGVLRCVAVDADGHPVDRNALSGSASVETFRVDPGPNRAADYVDAAQYDAVGLPAVPGAGNGDGFLVIGGAAPEYAACGGLLTMTHLFDDVALYTGSRQDTVATTLALAPCAADFGEEMPARTVAQFLVYNEYQQRFSTSTTITGQHVGRLSSIDSIMPHRSIFSAAVAGTLTGQTLIRGVTSGLIGAAIETHVGADPSQPHSAAYLLSPDGERTELDIVALDGTGCVGDCDGNRSVGIDELITGLNLGLQSPNAAECRSFDANGDQNVGIEELLQAVGAALDGCPHGVPPTPPPIPTPRPTADPDAAGPELTYFGLVTADDRPLEPAGTDDADRPVFARPHGDGFAILIEGRRGLNRQRIGQSAFVDGARALPDLQVIVARPLGDGSAAVCDADPPLAGGVPATEPFDFDAPGAVTAINDLGCRVDNGHGEAMLSLRGPCSRPVDDAFLASQSEGRFCLPIAHAAAFPTGDTIVAARLRDITGTLGPAQEIVVRVE